MLRCCGDGDAGSCTQRALKGAPALQADASSLALYVPEAVGSPESREAGFPLGSPASAWLRVSETQRERQQESGL